MYVRASFAKKAVVVQVSWLGQRGAKVAFRLRETRGPSSPVVTPLRECTLAPRPPHAVVSRRTDRLRKPVPDASDPARLAWCPSPPAAEGLRGHGSRGGVRLADPRTGEAPADSRGRNVRSRCRCSMCPCNSH
ncbi:hypothetical protein DPMN_131328 [Dreissena polymorpha]|uniref:Uncharacterized protein n=1 Tax=Dreissena polymorpha TaxID=45954 RepID=A0A9D4H6S0_DREPO|nr:hypothetical protein DPMN_131328 [Dreissena polymorpha]